MRDTIQHAGLTIRFERDHNCEAPDVNSDAVRMVILHRRYSDPAEGSCGTTPAEVEAWRLANRAEWFTMPLWLYDHSGTCYRAAEQNPFSCPWDSGRVGVVAIRKSEFGRGRIHKVEAIDAICREFTAWANGDCWSYAIEGDNGEPLDSCGGFIGREWCEQAAKEAAEAEAAAIDQRHSAEMELAAAQDASA